MRCEPWVSVRDNLLWEPKPSIDVIEVKLGNFGSRDLSGTWEEDGCSGATVVNDRQNGIVSVGLGETDDEVHSNLLKWKGSWVSGDLVHRGASAMGDDFVLLARGASLDVLRDPRSHVWPPIVPLSLSDGFVASGVSSYETLVYHSHDFSFERQVRGDCQFSFFSPSRDFSLWGLQETDRGDPILFFPIFHEESVFALQGCHF